MAEGKPAMRRCSGSGVCLYPVNGAIGAGITIGVWRVGCSRPKVAGWTVAAATAWSWATAVRNYRPR